MTEVQEQPRFEKFIHEMIATADYGVNLNFRLGAEPLLDPIRERRRYSGRDFLRVAERHEAAVADFRGIKKYRKGDVAMQLAKGLMMFLEDPQMGLVNRNIHYCAARCIEGGLAPVYVLGKNFYEDLAETDVGEVTVSVLPASFRGVLKFPQPLRDQDGYLFDEVMVVIDPVDIVEKAVGITKGKITLRDRELSGDDVDGIFLCMSWHAKGPVSLHPGESKPRAKIDPGYFSTFLPKDRGIKVIELFERHQYRTTGAHNIGQPVVIYEVMKTEITDGYTKSMNSLFGALVYVLSGRPDLRSYINPVRMQSEKSLTPVKADKHLSTSVPIHLVNYGWKKDPLYKKGVWPVRWHKRLQPYGPDRQWTKLVYIPLHWRERAALKGKANPENGGGEGTGQG
jgi:hypothetical protein